MRQITEIIINAFMLNQNIEVGDSEVVSNGEFTKLYLHGNLIACKKIATGETEISMAGYPSQTTRERLNGLPGVKVYQKQGKQYLNGEVIETDKFYTV